MEGREVWANVSSNLMPFACVICLATPFEPMEVPFDDKASATCSVTSAKQMIKHIT